MTIISIAAFAVLFAILILVRRSMKTFFWRITFCLLPLVVGGLITANATRRYIEEGAGFKLGVDLVGGTILVYEVDADKFQDEEKKKSFKPEELASRLKTRLDPNDLYNITIRPVSGQKVENTRVEIILPTGGRHQATIEQRDWKDLLEKVTSKWENLNKENINSIPPGNRLDLVSEIHKQTGAAADEIEKFIDANYKVGTNKKDLTSEQVLDIKAKIRQVGALEFRILANEEDDKEAFDGAKKYFEDAKNNKAKKDELEALAIRGLPPPPPKPPEGSKFFSIGPRGNVTYAWVEIGTKERWDLDLNNDAEDPWKNKILHAFQKWSTYLRLEDLEKIPRDHNEELVEVIREKTGESKTDIVEFLARHGGANWKEVEKARNANEGVGVPLVFSSAKNLIYSRKCQDAKLTPKLRQEKKFEYFYLTRVPEPDKEIKGEFLSNAKGAFGEKNQMEVRFSWNTTGANRFHDVTSKNIPTGAKGSEFYRLLGIILDGEIVSAPRINSAIRDQGVITGNFTEREVTNLVSVLNSGSLPATLKPEPVSENTMGATLGEDTIKSGTWSVFWAFVAILAFMLVYYRFAGLVASLALLANLLLTVAFMVLVNATFTLPGLAGLVLMLGMAVDANVLIYERLREERDRGASLALAIRNGYDRAFPTIIDTHLTSIFTAIVLYVVGNDQLKGFGISLTAGLIISLFTSLYLTRLMFDLWLARNWLHKLSMLRLLTRPNIDFMAIRYYWFTATILLTILGISIFIARLPQGLNIDFNGGTAYGGQLAKPVDIKTLRGFFTEEKQKQKLTVLDDGVKEIPSATGYAYDITYQDPNKGEETRTIHLPNKPEGETPEARAKDVLNRARELPDVAVEQIFPSKITGNESPYFTVRTSEKAPELVQAAIVRLMEGYLKTTRLKPEVDKSGKTVILTFFNKDDNSNKADNSEAFASPGIVKMLLERECQKSGLPQEFTVSSEGEQDPNISGQYHRIVVSWGEVTPSLGTLTKTLDALGREFEARPIPDRLETFDKQLALETQTRAMYAILASWGAILLYLWFRFGNWTFGMAAVICLIHDLFFTLGIIAFCHYLHGTKIAEFLMIQDFKIDLPTVAALLTLVGYSVSDTIVVFDRIREVRGKNPELTPQMINDSVNQTLSRTLLTAFATWLVVAVLYRWGGEGVHLFAFVMVVGVIVGTYSSIYIASPLLLIFGEGKKRSGARPERLPQPQPAGVSE